jgi:beta-phosphoglucomutase-like phosphatase (HAD superfamily)
VREGFDGIVFDFNGVLWWDSHLQEKAWKRFSAQIRGWPFSDEEMAVHIHGRNNRHSLEYAVGRTLDKDAAHRLSEEKESIYRALCLEQGQGFRLSPGAVELLDFLVARHIGRTIATASGKGNLDFFVKHLHLDRWFEIDRIVFDDGTGPGKPAPDAYLQAARNLALDPSRCIVVEDSRSGIEAARVAGIGHIVALGPASTHQRLCQLQGVDCVIEDLGQLPRERLFWVIS